MKRSKQVPLLILGSLSLLTGCEESGINRERINQNSYATIDDCRKDWGQQENCEPVRHQGGSGINPLMMSYLGPRYHWDRSAQRPMVIDGDSIRPARSGLASVGAPATARSSTSQSVSIAPAPRGGFGSTARGFSGGG